jgi:hypothetical protein
MVHVFIHDLALALFQRPRQQDLRVNEEIEDG